MANTPEVKHSEKLEPNKEFDVEEYIRQLEADREEEQIIQNSKRAKTESRQVPPTNEDMKKQLAKAQLETIALNRNKALKIKSDKKEQARKSKPHQNQTGGQHTSALDEDGNSRHEEAMENLEGDDKATHSNDTDERKQERCNMSGNQSNATTTLEPNSYSSKKTPGKLKPP